MSIQSQVLSKLCDIEQQLMKTETRYDRELLCDPETGERVYVRFEYGTEGEQNPSVGYLVDGVTPYDGDLSELVSCSSSVDRETVVSRLENEDGEWQVISFVDSEDPTDIVGPIYINPYGVSVPNPGNLAIYDVVLEDTLTTCECKPGEECAVQRTAGCRDDRRDDALKAIKKHTDKTLRPSDTLRGKSFIGTDEQLLNLPKASSVTVTLTGGVGNVEVTFDGGATRDYVIREKGSRTRGVGGTYTVDTSNLGFRGTDATTEYDVIAEIPA